MSSTGYLDEHGKYQRGKKKGMGHDISSQYTPWHHDIERKQYSREILQPRKNGKPSSAFVKAYKDEAKEYFTDREIQQAERELDE